MFIKKLHFLLFAGACALFYSQNALPTPQAVALDTRNIELYDAQGDKVSVHESDIEGPTVFLFKKTADSCLFWTLSDAQRLVQEILKQENPRMQLEDLTVMSYYIISPVKDYSERPFSEIVELFERFSIPPHDLSKLHQRWSIAVPQLNTNLTQITAENAVDWVTNQLDVAIIDPATGDMLAHGTRTPEQHATILQSRKDGTAILPFLYVNTTAQTVNHKTKSIPHKSPPKKSPTTVAASSQFSAPKIVGTLISLAALAKLLLPTADAPPKQGKKVPTAQEQTDALERIFNIRRKTAAREAFEKWTKLPKKPPVPPTTPPRARSGSTHAGAQPHGLSFSTERTGKPTGDDHQQPLKRRYSWPSLGKMPPLPGEIKPLHIDTSAPHVPEFESEHHDTAAPSPVSASGSSTSKSPLPPYPLRGHNDSAHDGTQTPGSAFSQPILSVTTTPARPKGEEKAPAANPSSSGKYGTRTTEKQAYFPHGNFHVILAGNFNHVTTASPQQRLPREHSSTQQRRDHGKLKQRRKPDESDSPLGSDHPVNLGSSSDSPPRHQAPLSLRRGPFPKPGQPRPTVAPTQKPTPKHGKRRRKGMPATQHDASPANADDPLNIGFSSSDTPTPPRPHASASVSPLAVCTTLTQHEGSFTTPPKQIIRNAIVPHSAPPAYGTRRPLYLDSEIDHALRIFSMKKALDQNTHGKYPRYTDLGDSWRVQRSESASPELVEKDQALEDSLDLIAPIDTCAPVDVGLPAYYVYQPEPDSTLLYFSWQDYLALVAHAKDHRHSEIINYLSAVNHVLYKSKKPLTPKQLSIARMLTSSSKFGGSALHADDKLGITRSLTEHFDRIGIKPTPCEDGINYFKVLEVPELAESDPLLLTT